MSKRILLFVITNLVIITTFSFLCSLFGVGNYVTADGLSYLQLLIFCTLYGFIASFISLAFSRIVAKKFMKVKIIKSDEESSLQWLAVMVNDIAKRAGLDRCPEVGVYRSDEMNAFATGPTKNRSLVAFSSSLLQTMDRDAIEGVAAHEIAHIQNGDMVTMTLLQAVVNVFVMFFARIVAYAASNAVKEELSQIVWYVTLILFQLVFGFAALLVTSWFSRKREFRADAGSAQMSGAKSMIKGLEFLQANVSTRNKKSRLPESIAAFGISGDFKSLFSTHPSFEDRIKALKAMS